MLKSRLKPSKLVPVESICDIKFGITRKVKKEAAKSVHSQSGNGKQNML